MMSHKNIVATIAGVTASVPQLSTKDVYLAYLPLAHVLELAGEVVELSVSILSICSNFLLKLLFGTDWHAMYLVMNLQVSLLLKHHHSHFCNVPSAVTIRAPKMYVIKIMPGDVIFTWSYSF